MPIFEYRCLSCGHVFEDVRSLSDADEPGECPKCGKPKTERIMSTFSTSGCGCGSGPSGGGFIGGGGSQRGG